MAYTCPKCQGRVERGSSKSAAAMGGLVGALFCAAFGSFKCETCGKLARGDFPPEVRRKMTYGSLGLVAGAIVLLVAVLWILTLLD